MVLIGIIIIISVVIFIIYKKYEKFVFEHSIALKKLELVNMENFMGVWIIRDVIIQCENKVLKKFSIFLIICPFFST